MCPMNKHIPYEIRLSQQNIRVFTRLGRHKGKRYIEIRFEVPEGKTVKFAGTSAQVFWNGTNQSIKVEFGKIFDSPFYSVIEASDLIQVKMMDIHEPMVGESKMTIIGERDKTYWLGAYLELPDSNKIQIILPKFMVNEELVTLPEIQFHRRWTIGFALINC